MKFHHVGIACHDIEASEKQLLGLFPNLISSSKPVYDKHQDATLQLFETSPGIYLELVSGKAVEAMLKKGIETYHTCFEVADITLALERAQREGAILISPPKPAILFDGRKVAFLKTFLGIIELLEEI